MKRTRILAVTALLLSAAACAPISTATRNVPLDIPGIERIEPSFDVTEMRIAVPGTLSVSESNSYFPNADIVWRDDPIGNRHVQIQHIFANAMQRGTAEMHGAQKVAVDVEILRFHSLTEKAHYAIGGMHSIKFNMTVRNAETGEIIIPTRIVDANLAAYGGRAALQAEANGQTQKVRITDHLTQVFSRELRRPLNVNS